MRFACALALAQLRHHRGRWALLAVGMSLVVVIPVLSAGLAHSVSAQTVRRTISALPLADRALLVSQEGQSILRRGTAHDNDVTVRDYLSELTSAPVTRMLLYRQLNIQGTSFQLGAADGLATQTRLVSGRLPQSCTPSRCEVVVMDGTSTAALQEATAIAGVVIVGQVVRVNPLLVTGELDVPGLPVLLGSSVDAMGELAYLQLFGRHYDWVTSVDPDRVVSLGVSDYVRRGAEIEVELSANVGSTSFSRPDDQLQAAADRADTSARRFGLLGGFAAVLLLGFAVVAAVALRAEATTLVRVLLRRGATTRQVNTVVVVAVLVVAAVALVVGLLAGGVAAAFNGAGLDGGYLSVALQAIGSAWLAAVLLVVAAAAVTVAVLRWPATEERGVWRLVDVIAVACLAMAVLAGDRGSTSASTLAGRTDPIVIALPVLAAIVAGLVAARLWQPAARLAERLLPARSVAGRIGLLGSIRRPLRPVATAAFLTAAIASVVFAGAYRSTLLANDADQAAFRVPLDLTVGPGPGQPAPLVPSVPTAGTQAYGVLRAGASVPELAGVNTTLALVGVDGAALRQTQRWSRTSGSDSSAATVADRLTAGVPAGPALQASARTVSVPATGFDPQTQVALILRNSTGLARTVSLAYADGQLTGSLPASDAAGWRAAAVTVAPTADYATRHGHGTGEGKTDREALAGRIVFGPVHVDGGTAWSWDGWGTTATGEASTGLVGTELAVSYRLTEGAAALTPQVAAVRSFALPVVVDPTTAKAAPGGRLVLTIDSGTKVAARVVGVQPRLPSVSGRFVLADRAALTTVLDAYAPGRNPTEFWVTGSSSALDRLVAAYRGLSVERRSAIQADLDADPVGRGARLLLVLVALLELAIAAAALVLLVVGERRDGAGELYAWEADGTRPSVLRRLLLVRTFAVAAVAVPVGVLTGLILARVGTTLVAVDSAGTAPTPPLQVTLGSLWTPVALVIGVGAGLLLATLVALRAMRERYPVAAEVDLR